MFAHGPGFVARHISGRYLRSAWAPPIVHPGGGLESVFIYALVPSPLECSYTHGADFGSDARVRQTGWAAVRDQFEFVPRPCCNCCRQTNYLTEWAGDAYRCGKHHDSNPCAIEGCTRTRRAKGFISNDVFLCSVHWRIACPPRSPMRRALNRLWRLHKKTGKTKWDPALDARYWRLWRGIIARARGRSFDQLEHSEDLGKDVMRFMGWEEAA